ncbi:type II toxin-antitoxin system VapC family toxin [Limnospira fusiformis KN01]|uniref:type II toxin-antitoxin system VapC family toxin n=1 Tax=Limnospira TaxID=2596745 RepID=UPI001F32A214|nr:MULTISPECIES: type II toxin-antitoxin system VapC family toxin [Limnospira]MDT9196899.1 type II toxin-antitoxin system VapC family toxin [Limnospira sp. PMC 1042.18]ULB46339.1 type II toxin-antitoxin system VapC family toxin [Limnospira fusiformis KN01]
MYLLDTNVCIALLKNHPNAVAKFAQHFQSSCLSSIVVSELYQGVYCSQKIEQNLAKLQQLQFMSLFYHKKR